MSGGNYWIFIERPIAGALFIICAALLTLAVISSRTTSKWRTVSGLGKDLEI